MIYSCGIAWFVSQFLFFCILVSFSLTDETIKSRSFNTRKSCASVSAELLDEISFDTATPTPQHLHGLSAVSSSSPSAVTAAGSLDGGCFCVMLRQSSRAHHNESVSSASVSNEPNLAASYLFSLTRHNADMKSRHGNAAEDGDDDQDDADEDKAFFGSLAAAAATVGNHMRHSLNQHSSRRPHSDLNENPGLSALLSSSSSSSSAECACDRLRTALRAAAFRTHTRVAVLTTLQFQHQLVRMQALCLCFLLEGERMCIFGGLVQPEPGTLYWPCSI